MDLFCPECRSLLNVEGRTARCHAHGADYEVLFDRETEALRRTSGSQVATPAAVCTNHPRTQAAYTCPRCSRPICTMCAFEVGGKTYCPDCATHAASGAVGEPELTPPPPPPPPMSYPQPQEPTVNDVGIVSLNLTAPPPPRVAPGTKCVQHGEIDAVTRCRVCSNGMCAVCDFALPNGMHVCPACIESRGTTETVSPRRNGFAWGGLALGIFTMVLFAVDIGLAAQGNLAGSKILDIIVLIFSVAGVSLSFSAFEPALGNTPLIWTGVVWNTVFLSVFVLLSIVGTFSG
jgi:hypothetical protein